MVGMCVNADVALGMIEASITLRCSAPWTRPLASTTPPSSGRGPIAHVLTTWGNEEPLVPHRGAEHMKTFGRVAVKCMTAPPKIEVITPANVTVR